MKSLSVRARLMIWNVASVAALTVLLGGAVSWRVRADLTANVDRDLKERARHGMGLFGPGPPPGGPPGPQGAGPGGPPEMPGVPSARREPGVGPGPGQRMGGGRGPGPMGRGPQDGQGPVRERFRLGASPFRPRLFDAQLRSATQFAEDQPWDPVAARQVLDGGQLLTTVEAEGETQRVLTMGLEGEGPAKVAQFAHPLSQTENAIVGVNHTLLGMLPFALFLAGLGGWYLTDRALRPVSQIAGAAGRVSGENLTERLPVQGQDEFAKLAATINSMLDRLEFAFRKLAETFEKEKRFTGDAAHELRSPLTAIKANTSLALSIERQPEEYRQTLQEIDRSATRMGELIDDLLLLARADVGLLSAQRATLDLREVVAEAAPGEVNLEFSPEAYGCTGDRTAIVRLFSNLLSNAFRHSPEPGSITVRSTKEGERILIEVIDLGEGIAREHLSHLGERFYRVDSARARSAGGVGLGLAISSAIVESHGGKLEFESEPGKGTTVRFTLPAA